jgi:hypothetical protein
MKVCVSCQKDVENRRAARVREDRIIKGIRSLKSAFRIAQNNELYVCEDCLPKHMERRKSFEKTMLFASVFAGLMMLVIIVAPLLSGRFDPWAVVSGVVVAIFILALPIFKYAPAVEGSSTMPGTMGKAPAQKLPPVQMVPGSGPEKEPEKAVPAGEEPKKEEPKKKRRSRKK